MSEKADSDLDEELKDAVDGNTEANEKKDEDEEKDDDEEKDEDEMLDQPHKSEAGSLAEEQSVGVSEEEALKESRSDAGITSKTLLTEKGEESASEEERVHFAAAKDSLVKLISSSQRIWDTEHEETSKTRIVPEVTGLEIEEDETAEELEEIEDEADAQKEEEIITTEVEDEMYSHTSLIFDFYEEEEEEAEEEEIEEEEEEEEEDEESIRVAKRNKLLQDYKTAKADQKKLHDLNRKLQYRLSAQLKKTETELTVQTEEEVLELEQQYVTAISHLNDLHRDQEQLEKNRAVETETLRQQSNEQRALADTYLTKLLNFRKHTVTGGRNKKSNRYKRAEQYSQTEHEKWMEASKVTLENILIKEEYDSIAKILKGREKVAEGLTMADFEQLKIENQICNEKIEEKNEAIAMVRVKLREAVQRLTHVKQKLNFINIKTRNERADLEEVEDRVKVRRQILSETKMARDRLKRDSRVLRQKSALLCFPDLLHDYEKKIDETDALRIQVAELRISHKDMMMEIRKLRQKMNELAFIAEATGEKY